MLQSGLDGVLLLYWEVREGQQCRLYSGQLELCPSLRIMAHKEVSSDKFWKLITASKSTKDEHKDVLHDRCRLVEDKVRVLWQDAGEEIDHCFCGFWVV